MSMIIYIKNSFLRILYFLCIFIIINMILLTSKPIDAQFADIGYMDFLLVFVSLVFAFIDYRKWKYSYKDINTAINKGEKIDSSLPDNNYYFEVKLIKDIVRLKNDEMKAGIKEVKSALDEVNDYITKWVHEVKIPLSVCELIADKIEETEESDQLILEIDRIRFLINQVLYTSRASSYSEDLQISEINIDKVVKEAVKRNTAFFISKNISLKLGNIKYSVLSDEKWITYIIDQLINNACKYVPEGGSGEIEIYAEEEEKAVKLYVKDNGIGIKKKDIGRIFDRGFTGENGRSLSKSTGMGLYLSKKIANKLSHAIFVESEEDIGTKFTICFYKLSDYFKVTQM